MSSFFKGAALFVAIACGIWVAVLWRWQATAHDMNTRDIVVYLGLLPVTVFAFALLLRWAWRGAESRAADAPPAAATTAAAQAAGGAEDAERHVTLQLLAAPLACAAGTSAADLLSAARDGEPRPSLDKELRDDDGLPVVSARMAELDVAALQTLLEPCLAEVRKRRPEWANLDAGEPVRRALAALREPLARAVDALAPWAAEFEAPAQTGPTRPAGPNAPTPRRVQVLLGWPADWNAFDQELGRELAPALIAAGGGPIPASRFVFTAQIGCGEELLLQADRWQRTLAREQRREPLIVAACHSDIGAAAVEALERQALLFSGHKRPKGRIPGEAAAALVLAPADWPAGPDADAPPPHLHRPAVLRRDKSVDAPGRVSSDTTRQAVTLALAASRLAADGVAALACDADRHSARGAELYGASLSLLPQLDSSEDVRLLATVTGAVGAVGALLAVACAAERAKADGKPCLAATLGDPFARLALVALPGPPVPAQPVAEPPSAGPAA